MNTAVLFPGFNQKVEDLEHAPFQLLTSLPQLGRLYHFYRGTLRQSLCRYGMQHVPIGDNRSKFGYFLDYTLKSFRFLRKHQIGLIVCFDADMAFLVRWAARWYRIPLILLVGVDWGAYNKHLRYALKKLVKDEIKRMAVKEAAAVVAITHHLKTPIEIYGRSPQVLYPFINQSNYTSEPHLRKRSCHELVFVGRLAPVKGIRFLIDCLPLVRARRRDFHLTIVGGSTPGCRSDEPYIRKQIEVHGLRGHVTLVGQVPHSRVSHYLRNADFAVMPSETEGFNYVLLEAWASGLPVLATDIPVYRELVDERVGRLCGFSPESMAEGILSFLSMDDSERLQMKHAAREKAERFNETSRYSWQRFAESCSQLARGSSHR